MYPILFDFYLNGKYIAIPTYWVFNLLLNPLVFVGMGTLYLGKKTRNYSLAFVSVFSLMLVVVVGSKVVSGIISYRDGFDDFFIRIFDMSHGYTMYGGFVISIPFWFILSSKAYTTVWTFLDSVTPGWALGICINKIGCHLNGCCIGIEANPPFGILFPMYDHPHPLLPVQLYEAAVGLAGFIVTVMLIRRKAKSGMPFAVFSVIYSFSRLILHYLREFPASIKYSHALVAGAYIAMCVLSIAVFVYRKR